MIIRLIIVIVIGVVSWSCNQRPLVDEDSYFEISGTTMGTYYRIVWQGAKETGLKKEIDSLLYQINDEVSTYENASFISHVNDADSGIEFDALPFHFSQNLERALYWYEKSDGFLDVSIGPLVNYWGFGREKIAVTSIDSQKVSSYRAFIGLDKWVIQESFLTKKHPLQQLDFSALAKGYAVDEIGVLLDSRGYYNYFIDIGGEGLSKGVNRIGNKWTIGIAAPRSDAALTEYEVLVSISDKALATSGNYRNFYEVDGRKYGHTINPHTGYPFQDELLSVTIITDRCIDADAIATACMAMGYTKASTFIAGLTNVSACFLVGAEDGSISTKFENGFVQYITNN